jgi:DNA mismatch endonuclease (patch repair protein)
MQANKRRDTGPELAIRSLLHADGLRFRVDLPLPFDRRRRADIVFVRVRLYVFVDGCFWHGCPDHFVPPKTRADFWRRKIERNVQRDAETSAALRSTGAVCLRLWEHVDPRVAAATVRSTYQGLRLNGSRPGT